MRSWAPWFEQHAKINRVCRDLSAELHSGQITSGRQSAEFAAKVAFRQFGFPLPERVKSLLLERTRQISVYGLPQNRRKARSKLFRWEWRI